ncbi:MAG: signal peptidase II [Waddliaceae bacterium]
MKKNRSKKKKHKKKRKLFSFLSPRFFFSIPVMSLFSALFVLASDMYTKYWVHSYLPRMNHESQWFPYNGIGIFENFLGVEFSIVHVTNRGAAWGILSDFQVYLLFFRITFILGLVVFLMFYNKNRLLLLPLTLVIVGAIGNILDYFIYGHVVDMLKFVFWGYDYPAFNLADSSITIGICSAILISMLQQRKALREAS